VTVRYPTLEDYLHAAAYVLDLPVETVIKASRLELAESALHAPQAGWGEVEFYPEFAMKAAVLCRTATSAPRWRPRSPSAL
jgi:death on curing protein